MPANIQFMETVNLLSPDKGDMPGFSGPSCILARCRFALGPIYRESPLVSSWSAMHLWIAGQ